MTKKPYSDRRWHDPPVFVVTGHRETPKSEQKRSGLKFIKFLFDKGYITEEQYQEGITEIEEKYKGHDPDERI